MRGGVEVAPGARRSRDVVPQGRRVHGAISAGCLYATQCRWLVSARAGYSGRVSLVSFLGIRNGQDQPFRDRRGRRFGDQLVVCDSRICTGLHGALHLRPGRQPGLLVPPLLPHRQYQRVHRAGGRRTPYLRSAAGRELLLVEPRHAQHALCRPAHPHVLLTTRSGDHSDPLKGPGGPRPRGFFSRRYVEGRPQDLLASTIDGRSGRC